MSGEELKSPLIELSKALGKSNRAEILKALSQKSYRNVDLSEKLKIRKERVSEALKDLTELRLTIKFEKESIIGEKHTFYVATPLGAEVLDIGKRLSELKKSFPDQILDFGDGVKYILQYYLEINDINVSHSTIMTRAGRKVSLNIDRVTCDKKNCEITCEAIIKNVVKKFGKIDEFNKKQNSRCNFDVKFWYS